MMPRLVRVCAKGDLGAGASAMKQFILDDTGVSSSVDVPTPPPRLLVARLDGGGYRAIGAKCAHFGAPLQSGALGASGRVRCHLHGAAFCLTTGDIEDYPGCDPPAAFRVVERDDDIFVEVHDEEAFATGKRPLPVIERMDLTSLSHESLADKHFVVVGGGPAGFIAVRAMRENNFAGRISLVTKEEYFPYDRILVNKRANLEPEKILLRPADFYEKLKIDVLLSTNCVSVNAKCRELTLKRSKNGKTEVLPYDKVLFTTGVSASRRVPSSCFPDGVADVSNVSNICFVRDASDAVRIQSLLAATQRKHVVVLGAGFIGMEIAATLRKNVDAVTVICSSPVPLGRVFGDKVGQVFADLAAENDVTVLTRASVASVKTEDGVTISSVSIKHGDRGDIVEMPCDIFIVSIGVDASTAFLKDSGIKMTSKGYLEVDGEMRTTVPNMYAAGDCTSFPLAMLGGRRVSIGHYGLAQTQGSVAAKTMVTDERATASTMKFDEGSEWKRVPYFWTMQYGKSVRYCGAATTADDVVETVVHGDTTAGSASKFAAFYVNSQGRVMACATLGWDPLCSQVAEHMHCGKIITKDQITSKPDGFFNT